MENKEFYNYLSLVYDNMIDFDSALKNRVSLLSNIVGSCKTAADLGCGTGIDSIALNSLGLKVDAFDHSEQMIAHAKLNASKHNAEVMFFTTPLETISFPKKYDLIVSLGNTIANIPEDKIGLVLQNCFRRLNMHGRLVIQILNYNLLNENKHIINETENELYSITRLHEKLGEDFFFHIKIHDKKKKSETVLSTRVYPYNFEQIYEFCKRFMISIKVYGDLKLNNFDKGTSKNLVIIGEKLIL
jgi:SAM-dependent methyltransferase